MTSPTLPAVALRGLLALAGVALVAAVVAPSPQGRLSPASLLLGTALLAWVVLSPASPAPTVLLLLVLVAVLDSGPGPWLLVTVQAALLSAVHLLAALCSLAPAGTRWELAALTPVLRRWGLAQAVCLPVVLVAAATPAGAGAGLDVAAGVLAVALVAGLLALARART